MPINYDVETDYLYQRGEIRGMEKERYNSKVNFITNLLLMTDFDDAKIGLTADIDLDFVRELRAKLSEKPKE